MKKKPVYSFIWKVGALLTICAIPGSSAFARHLQPAEALSMLGAGPMKSVSASQLKLAYTQESDDAVPAVYVFNREGAPGFYVLAADDAVDNIVLGYSSTGLFSADNMAPGLKWLLQRYSAQVSRCASAPAVKKASYEGLAAVTPLLSTVWNQYEPYNDMCPMMTGGRALTGCVATAMAQIMNKHQWPSSGSGSRTYSVSDGDASIQVSSDFSSHTYEWDNMLDDYYNWIEYDDYMEYGLVGTPEQKTAVAQLMFDCGVASLMDYGPEGSGANTVTAAQGMLEFFNYDKSMQYLMRDWYTEDDWIKLMHEQISQGLPVMYGGSSIEDYGHQFILDGYDGNGYFHFNWGWGGYDDGYFSLDSNAPEGQDITYTVGEDVLVNIRPDMGSSYTPLMAVIGALCTDRAEYESQNETVVFTIENGMGGIYSYALGPVEYELGVKISLDNSVVPVGRFELSTYSGFLGIGALSQSFPVGEYDVSLVYKTEDTSWTDMLYYVSLTSGKLHFVNDGTKIIVGESQGVVEATSVTLNTTSQQLNVGETFALVATVSPDNATDKTVTWATSDAAVATVDTEGKVTAVAAGTATITATCGSVSASCTVTVLTPIIEAANISLNTESVELAVGETRQIVATVTPEDATDKTVTWTTSDAAIATVDADGTVTGVAVGTAIVTATCGSVSATCEVAVKPLDGVWSVTSDGISISVADGCIYIQAPEDTMISVYDVAGGLYYVGYDHVIPVAGSKLYIIVVGDKAFKVKA